MRLYNTKEPCEWCQEEAYAAMISEDKTVCDDCWNHGRRADGKVTKEANASGSWNYSKENI